MCHTLQHSLYVDHNHVGNVEHSHKYDIALVELNEDITYNNMVQPACLPSATDVFEGHMCWLTGWGSTRHNTTGTSLSICFIPMLNIIWVVLVCRWV